MILKECYGRGALRHKVDALVKKLQESGELKFIRDTDAYGYEFIDQKGEVWIYDQVSGDSPWPHERTYSLFRRAQKEQQQNKERDGVHVLVPKIPSIDTQFSLEQLKELNGSELAFKRVIG